MIRVSGLNKSYGNRRVLTDLEFSIEKGSVVGFLGPNGAGKSTTMRILAGCLAAASGRVEIAGFDVFHQSLEVKKHIGYLPENPPVYLDMLVEDYLRYVVHLKGVPSALSPELIEQVLERVRLKDVRRRLIGNLSKGYRQRVAFAQALVSDPEVLILDEPTVGMDPKQVVEIRELIHDLRRSRTVILSTHILSEVEAICDHVIIINEGRIVAQDSLDNLLKRESRSLEGVFLKLTSSRGKG